MNHVIVVLEKNLSTAVVLYKIKLIKKLWKLKLKVIDEIIDEPLGGAHRDRDIILNNVRQTLTKNLNYFDELSSEEIMNERKNKFLKIGRNDGFMTSTEDLSSLTIKKNNLDKIFKSKKILLAVIGGLVLISAIFLLI